MSRVEININPQILRWAREEAGFDPVEIAGKVDIAAERYNLWEKEGKNSPLGKLKSIATSYKRQLAVFLLPTVPKDDIGKLIAKHKTSFYPNFWQRIGLCSCKCRKRKSDMKIPAVCKHFKVRHMNLFQFFDDNGWEFVMSKKF
jgi:hypothetical protein